MGSHTCGPEQGLMTKRYTVLLCFRWTSKRLPSRNGWFLNSPIQLCSLACILKLICSLNSNPREHGGPFTHNFTQSRGIIIIKASRANNYWALAASFPGLLDAKESACNVGDPGLIHGSGRSSVVGNGNPLQYSCLENSMDRGAWWTTVHGLQEIGHNWATNTFTC